MLRDGWHLESISSSPKPLPASHLLAMAPKAVAPSLRAEKDPSIAQASPETTTPHDEAGSPPPEPASDVRRRSQIVLSFWLIVLCLGLPIWWKTTTIYRANLPLEGMLAWSDGKARTPRNCPLRAVLISIRPADQSFRYRSPSRPTRYKQPKHRTSCV